MNILEGRQHTNLAMSHNRQNDPQPKGYLSLYDLAYIHDTTEQEVLRVWVDVLNVEPKEQFNGEDLLKVNRILSPVPEPWEIPNK